MEIRHFTLLSVALVFIALLFFFNFFIPKNILGELLKTSPAGLRAESLSGKEGKNLHMSTWWRKALIVFDVYYCISG